MFLKVHIREHERGLLFKRGNFQRLLTPGTHWLWPRLLGRQRATVEIVDTLKTSFEHPLFAVLLQHAELRAALEVVDLKDNERALVWADGRLVWLLGRGRYAFWKTPYRVTVEVFDIDQFRFVHPRLDAVLALSSAAQHLDGVEVAAHERVLLFRNGELLTTLAPGRHVYWKQTGKVTWKSVDLREQLADVAGQEIMTHDKVTLRANLLVAYQVLDPVKAVTVVQDYPQALYRAAQLALRAAVGTRTLDALLADKESIGGEVRNALAPRAAAFGVAVREVGLRDIILPGEMKEILNQVLTAEKQAQANLIKRREETAAARSQANTAKLLAENPALARMKELELLQEMLAGAKTTFVFGPGDIAEQVRSLVRTDHAKDA